MSETSVMIIRETTVDHIYKLWISCRNLKNAVRLGQDLRVAKTCAPEQLIPIAQKYGIVTFDVTM